MTQSSRFFYGRGGGHNEWQEFDEQTQEFLRDRIIRPMIVSADGRYLGFRTKESNRIVVVDRSTRQSVDLPHPKFESPDLEQALAFVPGRPIVAFSIQGHMLSEGPCRIALWNHQARQMVREWTVPSYTSCLSTSPDGNLLAAKSGGMIRIWRVDHDDPQAVHELEAPSIEKMVFSPDCRKLAAAAADGFVWIWSLDDPRHPYRVQAEAMKHDRSGYPVGITALEFTPDGKRLVVGGTSGKIRFYDPIELTEVYTLTVEDPVHSLAFSPHGDVLAVGGRRGVVRLYHATNQKQLLDTARRAWENAPGDAGRLRDLLLNLWGYYLDRIQSDDRAGIRQCREEAQAIRSALVEKPSGEMAKWFDAFDAERRK